MTIVQRSMRTRQSNIHRPLKRHNPILGAVMESKAVWSAIYEKKIEYGKDRRAAQSTPQEEKAQLT